MMQGRLYGSLLVVLTLAAACESPSDPGPGVGVEVTVSPTTATLGPGQRTTLTAVARNALNPAIMWRALDPEVASVSATGEVTGVSPGSTIVTAISVADSTKRTSAQITVNAQTHASMTVNPATVSVPTGGSVTLNVPGNGPVTWRSSAPQVASVNANGVVTGQATGRAVITALLNSDTTMRGVSVVTVTAGAGQLQVLGLGAVPERYTAEVAVRGTAAYTTTWSIRQAPGNTIKVWNVAGNTPVLVDSVLVAGAGTTGDIQISDDGLIMVVAMENGPGNGISLYNLGNPTRPTLIRQWQSPETAPGVHTVKLSRVNGRHYAFLSVNPGTSPALLSIVDITNPASPVQVWTQQMGRPYVHDVFVRDGILFAALWDDGLRIFDIGGGGRGGSPSAPVVMGSLPTQSGNIHNIWWFHDPSNGGKKYVFLGEEGAGSVGSGTASGDIHVIDVSNMSAPVQVAQYAVTGAGAHNFSMDEASGILYAAYYNGGVRALDVRGDLGNCTAAQRNSRGFCDLRMLNREAATALSNGGYVWGVAHQGTHLYASDMKAGLYKLDASGLKRSTVVAGRTN